MEEQIISFKTAKLAKEKGFDEYCSHYYVHSYGKSEYLKREHGKLKKFTGRLDDDDMQFYSYFRKNCKGQPHIIIAPTKSLLQKWLREEYGIHICLKLIRLGEADISYICDIYNLKTWDRFEVETEDFSTYGEALEIGLQEGLKLI